MSFADLQKSIAGDRTPPADATLLEQALWHDARGDWERSHTCAQEVHSRDGSWVHAYLHRKEGDPRNAGYWYSRAGKPMPAASVTLAAEWEQIARALTKG